MQSSHGAASAHTRGRELTDVSRALLEPLEPRLLLSTSAGQEEGLLATAESAMTADASGGQSPPVPLGTQQSLPYAYARSEDDLAIPDDGQWADAWLTVESAPADASIAYLRVWVSLEHPSASDLVMELSDQAETESWTFHDHAWAYSTVNATSDGQFLGQSPNQTWHLRIKDDVAGQAGYVKEWSLGVYYTQPGRPDLCASWVDLPAEVEPGGWWNATLQVRNVGSADSGSTDVVAYASADATVTEEDYPLGEYGDAWIGQVPQLAPGESVWVSPSGEFPELPWGQYYLGAFVDPDDSVAESYELNNSAVATDAPVTVRSTSSLPDLRVVEVSGYDEGIAGEPWAVSVTLRNGGGVDCGGFWTSFQLGESWSPGSDIDVGSAWVPGIEAGQFYELNYTFTFPTNIYVSDPWTSYALTVDVDSGDDVAESSEWNNTYEDWYGGVPVSSGTDLQPGSDSESWYSPQSVTPGQSWSAHWAVYEESGYGPAGCEVDFYASTDSSISESDYYLGTASPYWTDADLSLDSFPALPPGNYRVGVIIDPEEAADKYNRWDNCDVDADGYLSVSAATGGPDFRDAGFVGMSSSTVAQGETWDCTWLVGNDGDAYGALTVGVPVVFYLSTDSQITHRDYRLGTRSIRTRVFGHGQVLQTALSLSAFPEDLPPGTYYVGMLIDPNHAIGELDDFTNNASTEVVTLTVTGTPPTPNLQGRASASFGDIIAPGAGWTGRFGIDNTGTGPAGAFTVDVYASEDGVVTPDDHYLGSGRVDGLDADGYAGVYVHVHQFPDLPDGDYRIGLIVDADDEVGETDETDNRVVIGSRTLTVGEPMPDLVDGGAGGFTPTTVAAGDPWQCWRTIRNDGKASAGVFRVDFYASVDDEITHEDIWLGKVWMAPLGGQSQAQAVVNVTAMPALPAGDYYVGVLIDRQANVEEFDETNNAGVDLVHYPLTVTVPPPDVGDTIAEAEPLGALAPGDSVVRTGSIGDGLYGQKDVDVFAWTMASPGWLSLDVEATGSPATLDGHARLFDESGSQLATGVSHLSVWVDVAGTYYVGVSAYPNVEYDPSAAGSGLVGGIPGPYRLTVGVASADPLPDLSVRGDEITLTPDGGYLDVEATIRNLGQSAASDVTVQFYDPASGTLIRTIIPEIPAGGTVPASAQWQPAGAPASLRVTVDPADDIVEPTNANNVAEVVYAPATEAPVVARVRAQWDGNGNEHIFGKYIHGIALENTFTAEVTDPNGAGDIVRVVFEVPGIGEIEAERGSAGWSATLDVGQLSQDDEITVVAYDLAGDASEPWVGVIQSIPRPSWAVDQCLFVQGNFQSSGRPYYLLRGRVEPEWSAGYTFPQDTAILGGVESRFAAGVLLTAAADLNGEVYDDLSSCGLGLRFMLLDQVLDAYFNGLSFAKSGGPDVPKDNGNWSWVPESDWGAGLEITSFSAEYDYSLEVQEMSATLEVTLDFNSDAWDNLLTAVGASDYPIVVFHGKVPIPIGGWPFSLEVSISTEPTLALGTTITKTASGYEFFQPPTYIEPGVGLDVKGKLNVVDLGVASAGAYVRSVSELSVRAGLLDDDPGMDAQVRLGFSMSAGAEIVVGPFTFDLGEVKVFDETYEFPPAGSAGLVRPTEQGSYTGVLAQPDIVTLPDGRMLLAYAAGDTDSWDTDIFCQVYDGSWSTPVAVSDDVDAVDQAPSLTVLPDGSVALAWTRVTLTEAQLGEATLDQALASQEIYSARFAGGAWGTPERITDDALPDGNPRLAACEDGSVLALWGHDADGSFSDDTGNEIAWSLQTPSGWSAPAPLTSNSVGEHGIDLARLADGTILAAWVEEVDAATGQYRVCTASWDAPAWSTPQALPGSPVGEVRAVRVVPLHDGRALAVWSEVRDGGYTLLSAVREQDGTWEDVQTVADEMALVDGLQAEVSPDDTVFVFFHGIRGVEDILCLSRRFADPDSSWTPCLPTTGSDAAAWMPAGTVTADGDLFLAYAEIPPDGGDVLSPLGAQAAPIAGVATATVAVEADPAILGGSLALVEPDVTAGGPAALRVDVANLGRAVSAPAQVEFYDGDPAAGGVLLGSAIPLEPIACGQTLRVVSDTFAMPAGVHEFHAVIVGSAGAEGNDSAALTAEGAAPDADAPGVALQLPAESVVVSGTTALLLQFDEPVSGISEADVSVVEGTLGVLPPDHVYLAPDGLSARLIFEGGLPPAAGKDTYRIRIRSTVTDLDGNTLDGDGDGQPGGEYDATFSVLLAGDANADGIVGIADLSAVADNYGRHDLEWVGGDFNGDGVVGIADLSAIADNYGKRITPPAGGTPQGTPAPADAVPQADAILQSAPVLPAAGASATGTDRALRVVPARFETAIPTAMAARTVTGIDPTRAAASTDPGPDASPPASLSVDLDVELLPDLLRL